MVSVYKARVHSGFAVWRPDFVCASHKSSHKWDVHVHVDGVRS